MFKKIALKSLLTFFLIVINAHQALGDTIYADPIKVYVFYPYHYERVDDFVGYYNDYEAQQFNNCMEAAANEYHWTCIKYIIEDASVHGLNDFTRNGEPHYWALTGTSHSDVHNYGGHFVTDEEWDGLMMATKWSCPKGFQYRITGPADNQIYECLKTEEKSCPIGNPVDVFTGKKTEIETDYQSPNGVLEVERQYLSQESGWLMSSEPRLRHVGPGGILSLSGIFNTLNSNACINPYSLLLNKKLSVVV
ncbi:hypothetical protein [Candidatus Thiodiazotropha sp. LNASS1]|uniref:hypothetical protein n=1 Tax=Candidatus Thiodiazotropha sp. LNASS1 TaxID=3096260 RepID=UPI0034DE419D